MVEITNSQPLQAQVFDGAETSRQTLQSLNPSDDGYLNALSDFADKLMTRFGKSGNPSDLDEGLARSKELLDLTKPGDSSHLAALSNMGTALRTRFRLRGNAEDLTEAIECFQATFDSTTPEHPLYLGFVGNLASGLLERYRNYGDTPALDRVILTCSASLSASSDDRNRDSLLNNYANALKERFQQQGDRADLEMALERYQDCLDLRPPGHPLRRTVLGNLADAMLVKFESDSDIQALESAARHYTSALQLCSPGQEGYLLHLSSLGVTFWYAFMKGGDPQTLDIAIGCYSTALAQSTVANMDRVRILDNYGAALLTRHLKSGNINDLNQAIEYLTTSLNIQPSTFSGRCVTLLHLGTGLFTRFDAVGDIADLDLAIENLGFAVQSSPPGHQQRHTVLGSYGRALSARFEERGNDEDLSLAASACKEALALASLTSSTYGGTIANLTSTMLLSIRISGDVDEFQNIIDICDNALATPQSESELITVKTNRARAFIERFKYGREKKDIDIAVDSLREIAPLLSDERTQHLSTYITLALALEIRFNLTAQREDLDESIALFRIAQRGRKRGKFMYVQLCMNLGNTLRTRFEHFNDAIEELDEAIVLMSEAEEILVSTPGSSLYKTCLVNLGVLLFLRFQVNQNRNDLDEAIDRISHTLTLPAFSEDFLVQFSLAVMFSARSSINEDLGDLERSIELFEVASQQMPPKHIARAQLCRNYGRALINLATHRDPIGNLNSAVAFFQQAIDHLPLSHPDQPLTLMPFTLAYYQRSSLLNDEAGLRNFNEKDVLAGVVRMVPDNHPSVNHIQLIAAQIYEMMYKSSSPRDPTYLQHAVVAFEKAARYNHHSNYGCLKAGLDWVKMAEEADDPSALKAYQTSFDSLGHLLLTTASVKSRRAILLDQFLSSKHAGSLATDATSCALDQGRVKLAVELSEQGRGLLWSQLSRVRTPLDVLRSADAEGKKLADEFERIGSQLASRAAPQYDPRVEQTRRSTEEAARLYRQLTKKLDGVVAQIQAKEGFQSFLRRVSFQTLQTAAAKGPVILVNIGRKRCDAIIILHDEAPRLVSLPNATVDDIAAMSTDFYQSLKATSRVGEEKLRERAIVPILRNLWDIIVSPIVDELSQFLPRGSRIWWCPTSKLTSLPLHAAGPYRKGAHNLPSIYISSYTPTLTALIRSRHAQNSTTTNQNQNPALIAIGQSKPPESTFEPELKAVDSELSLVRSLLPSSLPFDHLSGPTSTVTAALSALHTHSWVHLACHGHQDLSQPFDSSFALGDRPLTLLDVVRADLVHPEFAFLSACHTAVGDSRTPDEVIHLAAGMQFSGFRSVIGTMWAVDDGMAQRMVREFYRHMFTGGESDSVPDCMNAARALNRAAKTVDQGDVSFDQRIVFIHIGA